MIHWIKHFFEKDGPTLVAKTKPNPEQAQRHRNLVKYYQSAIEENGKRVPALEEYILNELNAIKVDMTEQELYSFKKCVLMNRVIEYPILKTAKEMKKLDEGYELDCVAYAFPNYLRNGETPTLQLERNNEYRTLKGGGQWTRELWDEITIAYGVFKEDIELATPRFLEYIYALEHKKNGYD